MPLGSTEVIVGSFPKNANGVRNELIDVHVEMLQDANIPARIATLSDVGSEHKPGWAKAEGDFEPLFIVVPKECLEQALQINKSIDTGTVRICVKCEAYMKPGATKCPKCGVTDKCDPAQLRADHEAWLQRHVSGK